jgi:eukaryotic-like serine/threonine-protein kinase
VFRFITGKPLWVNILFSIGLVVLVVIIFLFSLTFFTKHGKTLSIPSVTGVTLPEATEILENAGFEIEIQDSVFVDTAAPLSVLRQFPEADAVVKQNRTVYLTINRAVAPNIDMPNIINMTFRSAEMALKQYGLKLEDTVYKPDFAKNAVLDQLYNGASIKPGTKIQMGSPITLVLGSGLGQDEFSVPDLFSLNYNEAVTLLESNNLGVGAVVVDPDVRDTANAFVYRQRPEKLGFENRINRIRPGQTIDIWLGSQRPVRQIDTTAIIPPTQ